MQYKKRIYLLAVILLVGTDGFAMPGNYNSRDSMPISTTAEAMTFLNGIQRLEPSPHWPNVDPAVFLQNLKTFAVAPLKFYEGKGTNFCSYSALSYVPVHYDPLGYSKFMITLYREGKAKMGRVNFVPGEAIKQQAGLLKYKGALDIYPAAQMWFLCLADHFKGYLNIFNRHYDEGDEDTQWASTNYAKFNRMLRKLFGIKVYARGSDLIHPWVGDRYEYLREKMKTGLVFVYLNNRLLYKKDHVVMRLGIPTHYVVLMDIYKVEGGKIDIIYWDYGLKTLQQITPKFLRKIVYGISHCPTLPK